LQALVVNHLRKTLITTNDDWCIRCETFFHQNFLDGLRGQTSATVLLSKDHCFVESIRGNLRLTAGARCPRLSQVPASPRGPEKLSTAHESPQVRVPTATSAVNLGTLANSGISLHWSWCNFYSILFGTAQVQTFDKRRQRVFISNINIACL
jgi:hypothetical protein